MKKLKVCLCAINEKTPEGTIAWAVVFLQPPTEEQVGMALQDTIARESQLSQQAPYKLKKRIGEKIVKGARLKRMEVIAAMQSHIAGISWILRQPSLNFHLFSEEIWDNRT